MAALLGAPAAALAQDEKAAQAERMMEVFRETLKTVDFCVEGGLLKSQMAVLIDVQGLGITCNQAGVGEDKAASPMKKYVAQADLAKKGFNGSCVATSTVLLDSQDQCKKVDEDLISSALVRAIIAIQGEQSRARFKAMMDEIRRQYLPNDTLRPRSR